MYGCQVEGDGFFRNWFSQKSQISITDLQTFQGFSYPFVLGTLEVALKVRAVDMWTGARVKEILKQELMAYHHVYNLTEKSILQIKMKSKLDKIINNYNTYLSLST